LSAVFGSPSFSGYDVKESVNEKFRAILYVGGSGPGNYSTAFPEKQDRKLSESEKILSQASKYNGGVVYYSGTDDSGDFYAGNKKTTSATGKEEIFDTPIQTFTGDENITNEIVKTNDVVVDRSIRIGGGKNNDV